MKKKSLSAKKTIAKNFNFKKILKDKKIFEIFRVFEKNFKKLKNTKKVAVSVSGGPDSLALCFLVSCFKFLNNSKIHLLFYLIDHGLRKGSGEESKIVKKHLNSKKINLKILKWKGKKPHSNLQSIARQKRYEILFKECKKLNIKTVLTAHHQDDFYETFFSRLLRGSGTEGLSSFAELEKKFFITGDEITLARPLLSIRKENLIYIANKVFNFYIVDPYNEMEKFQRVRIRKLILNLKNQGLNFDKLIITLNNLASSNKALREIVVNNISKNVIFVKKKYLIKPEFFSFPDEIVFRSLTILLKKLNKKYYPPRGKKISNLINEIKNKPYIKATLGGTIIEKLHNSVIITEEKTKK